MLDAVATYRWQINSFINLQMSYLLIINCSSNVMTMYSDVSNEEYELIKDSNKVKAAAIMTDFRERLMSEGQCLACAGSSELLICNQFLRLLLNL